MWQERMKFWLAPVRKIKLFRRKTIVAGWISIFVLGWAGTCFAFQVSAPAPTPVVSPTRSVFPVATPTPAVPTPSPTPTRSAREWAKDLADPDPKKHTAAANALEEMREQAIPELIETLSSRSPLARALSATLLWKLGLPANSATPKLKSILARDKDEGVRLRAAQALSRIEANPDYVVPHLTKCLKTCSAWGRSEAAKILGEFEPAAKQALPALKHALKDSNKDVRSSAKEAIRIIEGDGGSRN